MPRRTPYSKVLKRGQERPAHVQGQGDKLFKHFQCLAPECEAWITVPLADTHTEFQIPCSSCQHELRDGYEDFRFDYEVRGQDETVGTGTFIVDHGEYVRGARNYKYCINCYILKPLEEFGRHKSRQSGRQGECTSCKTAYNNIKNATRTPEQHREASERRRLLGLLRRDMPVDRATIRAKFGDKCFACDVCIDKDNFELDHTLPARLLWPLKTETATLLCKTCNGQKHDKWPSEFYDVQHLQTLAVLTEITFNVLSGDRFVNPEALEMIQEDPDAFLTAWIRRPDELKKLWSLVKDIAGVDIFENATRVPAYLQLPTTPVATPVPAPPAHSTP